MDRIIVKDLEIYAYHGVAQEEKQLGQKFVLTIEITADMQAAAETDDLNRTVHYGMLCDEVERVFTAKKYDLIEAAAIAVIKGILNKFSIVETVKILLKKPQAPLKNRIKYAAVELERSRGDFHE